LAPSLPYVLTGTWMFNGSHCTTRLAFLAFLASHLYLTLLQLDIKMHGGSRDGLQLHWYVQLQPVRWEMWFLRRVLDKVVLQSFMLRELSGT
jgi:hypothetical protein